MQLLAGEELEQLPDCRQPPRARGRRQTALGDRAQVGGNIGRDHDGQRLVSRGEKGQKIVEVAPVGLQRVVGCAPLGRQHLEELADQWCWSAAMVNCRARAATLRTAPRTRAAGIRLQARTLQRPHRVAQSQDVGALRAVGAQRAHRHQNGAAGVLALRGLRQVGQHARLRQIAGRGLRRAACRLPDAHRHIDVERIQHGCQPMQDVDAQAPRPGEVIDGGEPGVASAARLRIGQVDQRQPVLKLAAVSAQRRASSYSPAASRDLHHRLGKRARLGRGPELSHQRRQHARRLHVNAGAARIVEQGAQEAGLQVRRLRRLDGAKQLRPPQDRIARLVGRCPSPTAPADACRRPRRLRAAWHSTAAPPRPQLCACARRWSVRRPGQRAAPAPPFPEPAFRAPGPISSRNLKSSSDTRAGRPRCGLVPMLKLSRTRSARSSAMPSSRARLAARPAAAPSPATAAQ